MFRKKSSRFIKKVVWFVLILSAVGAMYQHVATLRDRERFPAPGQFYEVNGQRLHFICEGVRDSAETPITIIESGRGKSSLFWSKVMPLVSPSHRACTYDRPGLGWSDPSKHPVDGDQTVANLHALLEAAGEKPPYVMAGHSIGGILVRDYYHLYPDDVIGIVLIDSALEIEYAGWRGTADYRRHEWEAFAYDKLGTLATRLGAMRLYRTIRGYQNPPTTTSEIIELAKNNEAYAPRALAGEMLMTWPMISRMPPMQAVGDVPLMVLEQTLQTGPTPTPEYLAFKAHWHQQQIALAELSQNSQLIEVADSGHNIPDHAPEAVAEAIIGMFEMVK